ncbi:MAG: GlsB/YeaQ/YmgE family stress response membrane protein [bacterium]
MSFLWSAIIGLIAGAIAKLIMPGKDPGGIFITMLIGIAGAILFTFLGRMMGFYHEGESAGFIASILGALVLLGLYRLIKGRGAARGV